MKPNPLVSIIVVDYRRNNPYLIECFKGIAKQTYKNFEVILVADYKPSNLNQIKEILFKGLKTKDQRLKTKIYGHYVGPAEKRDWGGESAKGEILAFIDDDAYPSPDWLKNIVRHFSDKDITGVGGPGITPPGVSWQETASGWMSASPLGAGPYTYRFLPGKDLYVDDYPSMNLSVRRSDFLKVGGFDSNYWPGEDTKLCLDLTQKLKKKIIYEPKAIVYHHRRPLWKAHLRQNGNYGLHRGFFARILPKTSFRPVYFVPSLMTLGVIFLPFFLLCSPLIANGIILALFLYLLLLIANAGWIHHKSHNAFQALISIPEIFITHFWYGLRFLQGFLFTKKLTR